jgi:WD40 repeat protein
VLTICPILTLPFLTTANWDKVARVWDVASGEEVAGIPHNNGVNDIAFSPDGKYLATASDDNFAHVQPLQSEGLINEACQRLTRYLTKEEWKQCLRDEPYNKTCLDLPEPEK